MREINNEEITKIVEEMIVETASSVDTFTFCKLKEKSKEESSPIGTLILNEIIKNDILSKESHLPVCQDTGIVVCFLEVGLDIHFKEDIYEAINEGVRRAYINNYFRKSVVKDPLDRINTLDNTPAIIHTKLVKGDTLKIKLMLKGAGSENMSKLKMLTPADGIKGIKKFVKETVTKALGNPCPPISIGIGIGGDFEECSILAKEALFLDSEKTLQVQQLEKEILEDVNNLGIGPMGLGGSTTCLFVSIKTAPCHIASLPVAICIQCHASRHAERII